MAIGGDRVGRWIVFAGVTVVVPTACFGEASEVDSGDGSSSTSDTTTGGATTTITTTSSTTQGGTSSPTGSSSSDTATGSSTSGETSSTTDATGEGSTTDGTSGSGGTGSTGTGSSGTDSGGTDSTTGSAQTQTVWFLGDYAANNQDDVGRADLPDGAPAAIDFGGAWTLIDAIAVSPDGAELVVGGGDSLGEAMLRRYPSDGVGTPVELHAAASTTTFRQIEFSPDGTSVAFIADGTTDGENALYVVPADATADAVPLSPQSGDAALDVDILAWSRDSSRIVYIGDVEVDNEDGIWAVDPTAVSPSPVPLFPTDSLAADNRVRSNMVEFDAAGRVYFLFDNADGSTSLYRVDTDGSDLELVPGTGLTNGNGAASVISVGISDAGDEVAFAADSPQAGVFEVFVVSTEGTTAERVSDVSASVLDDTGAVATHPIVWSPDGTTLAVISDWVVGGSLSNDNALWLVPSSAPAGGVRIMRPDANNNGQDVSGVDFSADGLRLFVRGDLLDDNDEELYETDDSSTAEQAPSGRLLIDVASNGDVRQFVTDR